MKKIKNHIIIIDIVSLVKINGLDQQRNVLQHVQQIQLLMKQFVKFLTMKHIVNMFIKIFKIIMQQAVYMIVKMKVYMKQQIEVIVL